MTNAEMLTLLASRLGHRTSTALRANVLIEMNEKIRQLERADTMPWFLEDTWLGETIVSQDYVPLISDYLREDDEGNAEIQDTTVTPTVWAEFHKVGYDKLRKETANALPALPVAYSVKGEKLYVGPIPDQIYNFRIPYYKRSTPVVDNNSAITNKWLLEYFNFVTLDTIDIVARTHTRDQALVVAISGELQQAQDAFMRDVEARIHAGREYLLTDEEN